VNETPDPFKADEPSDDSDLPPVIDDWSLDATPETSTPGDALSAEDAERLQAQNFAKDNAEMERLEQERREQQEMEEELGRQRRQNVRVTVQYPVTINATGHPSTPARTRDISATGIGFATRLSMEPNSAGTITVQFPDWTFTKEFVVRFAKPIIAGTQVGAEYVELTADERERLVKEVFAVQRQQIQQQRLSPR
jgi:hypothetical protein